MKTFALSTILLVVAIALTFAAFTVSSKTQAAIDSNCIAWVFCGDLTITIDSHLTPLTMTHESAKSLAAYSLLLGKHGLAAIVVLSMVTIYAFFYAVQTAYIAMQIASRKHNLGMN